MWELSLIHISNLELKCKVYNINDGKNKAIMESGGWLNDYMTFVNKVRELSLIHI